MVSLKASFTRLAAVVSVISFLAGSVASAPVEELEVRKAAATPAAPHWVAYSDEWISGENGPPSTSSITGFNTFILSFLLLSGPADQAVEWTLISASDRATIKSQYAAAGIKLLVSAFGSTDAPTSEGADPVATANTMAAWVKQYDLDGIDVDYEDFNAFDGSSGSAVTWLESFTKQLRVQLPQGQYILTHAPVAPWFQPNAWAGGGYLAIDKSVGSLIDWYNVQFYNQGSSEYTTCNNLLTTSGGTYPGSSVFEIAANGVSLDKIVIGKPGNSGDADSGYMSPSTLASCLVTAKSQGWNAGVMTWEYPDAGASWIKTVRASAFPE
ncbi:glycoside hydrolase family 18 protein [Auriscalpium vulgare]|uniref:Glycoside hydrolase family 18 protein n=1 Tax=Auriscalpium vulgare TaxID=40419 RepID=A0ACB8RU77_9AGAM|nr:glycoside hydrolase family 18 protein [Auriscalpium vulgare]